MKNWQMLIGIVGFVALAIVGLLATVDMAYAYTSSNNVTGQVTVPAECMLSLNTSSIGFGSVAAGTNTGATNQVVNVTNNGNAQATNTTTRGTQWSDGGVNNFVVGQTQYSTSGFTYGAGTALTASDVVIAGGNLNKLASLQLYFGVAVPASQNPATYNQTITVTMNC